MGDFKGEAKRAELYEKAHELLINDLDTPSVLNLIDDAVANYSNENENAEALKADIKATQELLGL